jgi:hypothetical protein
VRLRRATVTLLALGGAGGAALFDVAAYHAIQKPLAPSLEGALAQALQLPRERVSIRRAWFGWPGQLVLDDLSTGDWAATRIEVAVDPWAALGGRWRPSRARARGLFCDLGVVDEAEATWGGGKARLVLSRVNAIPLGHWLGGLAVSLGEVGIDLESGGLKRMAFTAARVGPIDGLAGAAVRAPGGGWLVRAARPGLRASAHLGRQGVTGQAQLESYPLHGWPAPRGVELAGAVADGKLAFDGSGAGATARLELTVSEVTLDHRAIAKKRVDGLSATLAGEIERHGDLLSAHDLHLGLGRAALVLDGELGIDGHLDASATLPAQPCADLWAAVPRDLVPHLGGLVVDGELAGRVHLSGAAGSLRAAPPRDDSPGVLDFPAGMSAAGSAASVGTADSLGTLGAAAAVARLRLEAGATSPAAAAAPPLLRLEVDGRVGCRVRNDAAQAEVAAAAHPDAPVLLGHRVDGHPFPLGPGNPAWRALESLSPSLVRTILVSEDGRFYHHHGFDFDNIGRALGTDVAARRFARGASTITQQVAKNLWLDGERSLSRKLEEAVLAWRLEQVLDKRRILELYLNLVELGPGIYGVADAADRYFGKLPEELSTDEAAQLAALLPAPRRGMDAAWERRYRALAARLPSEKTPTPPPVPVKLSRR